MTPEWQGQKPTELDLAWLGGFFDGEGCICFSVEKKTGIIQPRMNLVNTNKDAAENFKRILSMILQREIRWIMCNRGYKPLYNFRVKNHGEMQAICAAMLPYLIGKRPQAELMLYYLSIKPGKGGRFRLEHYQITERMKQMNKRYAFGEWEKEQEQLKLKSQRETKRLAPRVDDVIVQTALRNAEAAEMPARLM